MSQSKHFMSVPSLARRQDAWGGLRPLHGWMPPHQEQIHQGTSNVDTRGILGDAAIAHLGKPPQPLDDQKGVFDLGADLRLGAVSRLFLPPASTVRYYFDAWTRIPDDTHMSLLDRALKKNGGARAQEKWAAALDELLHRGCTKRQEHRHGTVQGV